MGLAIAATTCEPTLQRQGKSPILRSMNGIINLTEFFASSPESLSITAILSLGTSMAVVIIAILQSGPSRDDDDQGPGGGGGLMQPVGAGA